MIEICVTACIISLLYNLTKIAVKKMELSYMDRKNQKEGKYLN